MKRMIVFVLLAAFLLTTAAFASEVKPEENTEMLAQKAHKCQMKSQKRMMKMRRGMKRGLKRSFFLMHALKAKLNLTDAQVDKLAGMKADYAKKMIDRRATVAKLRVDLKMQTRKMNMDIPAVEKTMRKISDQQLAMKIDSLKAFENAKSVLTAAQKAKLQQLWDGKYHKKMKMHKYKTKKKMKSENPSEDTVTYENELEEQLALTGEEVEE